MGNGAAAKKIATTALQRIEILEQNMEQLYAAIGQTFSTVEERFSGMDEKLSGLISVVGADNVATAIIAKRAATEASQIEAAKANLEKALVSGDLIKADVVGPKSMVVGTEVTAEGKPIGYVDGRVQLFIDRIIPAVRDALLGNGVGTEVETTEKGKFTVTEIYDVVEKPDELPIEELEAAAQSDAE